VVAAAAVLFALLVVGGTVLRSTLPPPPLQVALASLDGSALAGDSFVRLQVQLRGQGVQALGDVRLTVAGVTQRGLHAQAFDDDGRVTVQVDVTPACAALAGGVRPGSLHVQVRDTSGATRMLQLPVPTRGSLERLLRYRCRT
jgi:hypothetical protein